MTKQDQPATEKPLADFDEYLRRVRGVGGGARSNYVRFAGAFLRAVSGTGPVEARDVEEFFLELTHRYQPATVSLAASALRSFFRFLRMDGLPAGQLEDAVPMVPRRRSGLVRHLDPAQLERLIASLGACSGRRLRDRAIIVCIARLGLRSSEVVQLRLEDLDWHNAVVRVRARKSGHGAVLPLPAEAGEALAAYLQYGRPPTRLRQVFVQHGQRAGAPVSTSVVGRAVDDALRRAGIEAPGRGANLLRHSLATALLGRGASLSGIASVLGHRSLATTRIYAAVDAEALRQAALPWPEAGS
jgi:integrase/recombinase XerD